MSEIITFFSILTPILLAIIGYLGKNYIDSIDKKFSSQGESFKILGHDLKQIKEDVLNMRITNDKINHSIDINQFKSDTNITKIFDKQVETIDKIKQVDEVLLKVIKTVTILKNSTDKNAEEIESLKIQIGDDSVMIKSKKVK